MTAPRCIDCKRDGVLTARKASGKPLLCATHRRSRRFNRRTYTHTAHILNNYNLTADEYQAIYAHQGGRCAICRKGTGKTKKLSVDHDHKTGMIRGLLDQKCNRDVLGHFNDDIEALQRAIDYLRYPPAVDVIGVRITPDMAESASENAQKM